MQWHSQLQAARILSVVPATIAGLIEDGELEAVNVARKSSKRKRYRISDGMLSAFQEKRTSLKPPAPESKSARRTIARPTKDFFAPIGGAK